MGVVAVVVSEHAAAARTTARLVDWVDVARIMCGYSIGVVSGGPWSTMNGF